MIGRERVKTADGWTLPEFDRLEQFAATSPADLNTLDFDEKYDPTRMEKGWSFEHYATLRTLLAERFPELEKRQKEIDKTGGKNGAWWYWKGVVRHSRKMTKWWWYVLGTWIPDFDRIMLKEAKHLATLAGIIVHFVVPEPILDGILGIGPKITLYNDMPNGARPIMYGSQGASLGSITDALGAATQAFVPVATGAGANPNALASAAAGAVGKAAGDIVSKIGGYVVKGIKTVGRILARLFSFGWKKSPPDKAKGALAAQVISPLFLLEHRFGNTHATRVPTGVPPRTTDTILEEEFKGGAGLLKEQEKAGQIQRKDEPKVFEFMKVATPGQPVALQRAADRQLVQLPSSSVYIPAVQEQSLPSGLPPWVFPVGLGVAGLGAVALLINATRR